MHLAISCSQGVAVGVLDEDEVDATVVAPNERWLGVVPDFRQVQTML